MASRREARMNIAQNDALFEFESFKKKYLLVNKHVTKLNSTLSVRIEELNAQISKLQVENLRLRSSNISLTAQLKRERELKGRDTRTIALVDAATAEALRQLTAIRDAIVNLPQSSLTTPHAIPTPPSSSPTNAPTRTNGPVHPGPSTRLPVARAPEFPSLVETSETPRHRRRSSGVGTTDESDSEMEHHARAATIRPVPGAHCIPAPSYLGSEAEMETKTRRQIRRQSGLLARGVAATQSGVDDDGRETSPAESQDIVGQPLVKAKSRTTVSSSSSSTEPKRGKRKLLESDLEDPIKSVGAIIDVPDEHEPADEDEDIKPQLVRTRVVVGVNRLQDVTNSPRQVVGKIKEKGQPIKGEPVTTGYVGTPAVSKTKPPRSRTLIPAPTSSSGRLTPAPASTDEETASTGRERRVRKSVNYAEPKLNTKMRKPTPDATSYGRFSLPTTKPRISTSIPQDSSPSPESPMPPLLDPPKSDMGSTRSESLCGENTGITLRAARRRRPVPAAWGGGEEDGGEEEDLDADDEYAPHAGGVRRKSSTKAWERRHSGAV